MQSLRNKLTITAHAKKGIKQDSDPGIFPGIQGINPVSFRPRAKNPDSMYFQNQNQSYDT